MWKGMATGYQIDPPIGMRVQIMGSRDHSRALGVWVETTKPEHFGKEGVIIGRVQVSDYVKTVAIRFDGGTEIRLTRILSPTRNYRSSGFFGAGTRRLYDGEGVFSTLTCAAAGTVCSCTLDVYTKRYRQNGRDHECSCCGRSQRKAASWDE
jgi:hypothetical protein